MYEEMNCNHFAAQRHEEAKEKRTTKTTARQKGFSSESCLAGQIFHGAVLTGKWGGAENGVESPLRGRQLALEELDR